MSVIIAWLIRFARQRQGSVSVLAAVALPALIGFVALSAEFGHGLVTKVENQRIADLAAYAGALAYTATSSTTTMTAAAQNVAALNGIATSAVTASLVASPRTTGSQAVLVNVTTTNSLLLSRVVNYGTNLTVTSKAYAELAPTAPACVLAINSGGTGITLSGGTSVSAPNCSVASNNTLTVPCATYITAKTVVYNGAVPSQPCTGITAPISKTATTDPLASNSAVVAATAHAATLTSLTAPTSPTVPTGTDISFAYSPSSTMAQATAAGCSASFSGSTWTLTCPSGGTYYFGAITLGGGINVNFNTSGSSSTTYDFSSPISNSGSVLTFGPGTYNIAKGIVTGGGTTTTFGAGTYRIGAGTTSCNGSTYSICNTGSSLSFSGPSSFSIAGGVYNAGGSSLTLGSSSGNTISIGPAGDGNAVYIGGGATTTFAETDSNTFQIVGNFNEGGGSCTTLGIASQHDFYGNFITAAGVTMGAGVYSVSGYIAIGANGGGSFTCGGTSVGVNGTGVTLVTRGLQTINSGTCSGASFCIGSGFNNVTLSAPTSGTYANLAILGPTASSTTGGAMLNEGSATSLAGAVYFPKGALTLTGGATVGNISGQCLQVVATQITLSGGTSITTSSCFTSSTSSNPIVVQ